VLTEGARIVYRGRRVGQGCYTVLVILVSNCDHEIFRVKVALGNRKELLTSKNKNLTFLSGHQFTNRLTSLLDPVK
jgi:hypothetical protein